MRSARSIRLGILAGLLLAALPSGARGTTPLRITPGLELVGSFVPGAPITGAKLSGSYLYVTSAHDLSIYDVSEPLQPQRLSSSFSDTLIHGELLPTNDRILLLNDWPYGSNVDIWDVENKDDPQLVSTIGPVPDEHFGCVLDCRWAYGNEGTILDLRRPSRTKVLDDSWTDLTGLNPSMHRVDEFRPGYLVTAPFDSGPVVVDARRPLRPRVVARGGLPLSERYAFLYGEWSLGGEGRYLLASVERFGRHGNCGEQAATLLAWDTARKRGRTYPKVGEYELPGVCSAYYLAPHPGFERNGLVALPHGLGGLRLIRVGSQGELDEVASFDPGVGDIWHTFWVDEEILYVLNQTGQVYILRYTE